jgi:putative hemolysin
MQREKHMARYGLLVLIGMALAGCSTLGTADGANQAQQVAVNYCEQEGGEVRSRQEAGKTRQYCHLLEGRVVEVNLLYQTEGLRVH